MDFALLFPAWKFSSTITSCISRRSSVTNIWPARCSERMLAWPVGEDYYVVAPRDDKATRCQCPDCRAAIAKAGTNWPYFSSGEASELVWGFLNKVQQAINESHPGKHIAACFNYFDYTYYPKTLTVDTNIYIGPAVGVGWFLPFDMKGALARIFHEFLGGFL